MGELLLCRETIAALPYYVEEISQNIYSMEELSYFLAGNLYLLDDSFMNEELCTWIEQQMKRYKLAERLRDMLRGERRLSDFVLAILEDSGYCTPREMQDIAATIRQMEEKSDFECSKLRADQLMEKGKLLAAVYAYKRLLESEDAAASGDGLCGNIWHNLGTANARLFLFEEAAGCFEAAYQKNGSGESLRACLLCFLLMGDQAGFSRAAERYGLDAMGIQSVKNELAIVQNGEKMQDFEKRLDELREGLETERSGAREELQEIIFQWKESYRKSCKV